MHTRVLRVDPMVPEPAALAEAASVLRRGGLVAFPTETVYGLGGDAENPEAIARIYQLILDQSIRTQELYGFGKPGPA